MSIDIWSLGFCCTIAMMLCTCGIFGKASEEDLRKIRELHETDWAASKAHDIETLRTLWTEDAVLLPPGQEPIVGDEAIWDFMKSQLPEMRKYDILEYRHDFEEIEIVGDWAFEWGTFYGKYRPVRTEEILEERSRLFRILKKQADGSWKVARAMWHSLPAEDGETER